MIFLLPLAYLMIGTYATPIVYLVQYMDGSTTKTYRRDSHIPDAYAADTIQNMLSWSNNAFAADFSGQGTIIVSYIGTAPTYQFAYTMSYEMARTIHRHKAPGPVGK